MLGCHHQVDDSPFSHRTGVKGEASGIALLLNTASLGGQHRMGTVRGLYFLCRTSGEHRTEAKGGM